MAGHRHNNLGMNDYLVHLESCVGRAKYVGMALIVLQQVARGCSIFEVT